MRPRYLSVVVSALALALLASCTPPGTQPLETSTTPEGDPGITRVSAGAECNSHYDPDSSGLNWASLTYQLYTICYDSRYQNDVAVVKRWLDATLELGQQKYGAARPTRYGRDVYTTVFLPPVATGYTSQGLVRTACCVDDGSGYRAEIHYLTPSAWSGDRLGGLGIPVADYHPHYVMHEMSHVVQYGFPQDSRPPAWIIEGLAEYDAFFYSTAYNRTTAIDSLIRRVHSEREQLTCCSSGISTSSLYYGGAVIMIFLAERFGEEIHVELLTTPLEVLLVRRGTTAEETYDELLAWLEQRAQTRTPRTQPRTQPQETPRTQPRGSAGAECDSHYDPDSSGLNWASLTYQLYTICYDSRYQNDVAVVERWLDATLELGQQKYGIARPTIYGRGGEVHTTVFLPPVPTQYTSEGLVRTACCYKDGSGYRAEIHYLTPSVWSGNRLGNLGIPVADYHPHYVMHEMSHVVQYGFPQDSRPPAWIIEGLAEYDAFFYSTEYNRTLAIDSLIRRVHSEREQLTCCSSGISTSSLYYGGAVIMIFLAERFGEEIHVELLTTPLEDLLVRRGTTAEETYDELLAWLEQRVQALGETPTTREGCNSQYDPDLSGLNWTSLTHQFYTICYNGGYKGDAVMVANWLDATLELGRQKYGVARPTYQGRDLHTTVFLPSVPTQRAYTGRSGTTCCYEDGLGPHAEILYLTPSAWRGDRLGGLRIPAKDYHPHFLTRLMARNVHYGLGADSRFPSWIRIGLAEYDGYFYTTAYNRTTAIDSLIRHVYSERGQITCCSSGISTPSPYYFGAVIMIFLAEWFGEEIHAELFTAPLEDLLEQRGMTVEETFAELQAWLERRGRVNSR